jgi:hypothetical protein
VTNKRGELTVTRIVENKNPEGTTLQKEEI